MACWRPQPALPCYRAVLQPERVIKTERELSSAALSSASVSAPGAEPPPNLHLAATDGWIKLERAHDPALFPRRPGTGRAQRVHLRVPRCHGVHRPGGAGPKDEGAAVRPDLLARSGSRLPAAAHQPGSANAAGSDRLAHAALSRVPQRDSDLRRRAALVRRHADHAQPDLLLPAALPRHLYVPLPLRGDGARAHGHDRPMLHPAEVQPDVRAAASSPTTI